jgi:hypothetical protein
MFSVLLQECTRHACWECDESILNKFAAIPPSLQFTHNQHAGVFAPLQAHNLVHQARFLGSETLRW